MIQTIKKFAVNWTDGMKISERHFVAHDDFLLDTVRDANSLRCNSFNYGLLPIKLSDGIEETIFNVYNTATNDIQIVIKQCSALTAAGYRIELSDYTTNVNMGLNEAITKEENTQEAYYILISSNPFDRIPFGDIDSAEIPPRHPFTQTKYTIELLSEAILKGGSAGGNYLIIGKVNVNGNLAEADRNFIPPCTNIYSHPKLLSYYRSFAKSMGNLQQYALVINQKVVKTTQNSSLAINVKILCNTILNHIASVYFNFRNIVPQQPPIYMIEAFSSLALKVYYSTELLLPGELEEMLNYSFEWSEVAPHTLLNQLAFVSEINYDHNDCGDHLIQIQQLLNSLETIFNKLSSLDYIGQRKENIIINDTDITPKTNVKKGWSLLD